MRPLTYILWFVFGALALVLAGKALAHGKAHWIMENPQYTDILNGHPEIHCCGENDCKPWPESDVELREDGYFLRSTGETIPYNLTHQVRPDQTGESRYWRCHSYDWLPGRDKSYTAVQGGYPTGDHTDYRTRCFFAPGGDV